MSSIGIGPIDEELAIKWKCEKCYFTCRPKSTYEYTSDIKDNLCPFWIEAKLMNTLRKLDSEAILKFTTARREKSNFHAYMKVNVYEH